MIGALWFSGVVTILLEAVADDARYGMSWYGTTRPEKISRTSKTLTRLKLPTSQPVCVYGHRQSSFREDKH